jgi:hypothetical protein
MAASFIALAIAASLVHRLVAPPLVAFATDEGLREKLKSHAPFRQLVFFAAFFLATDFG